jgi:hypothetical protein
MHNIEKIKEAVARFEAKVRAQGLVVNARDAEHLELLKALLAARLKETLAELETTTNTNNQNR